MKIKIHNYLSFSHCVEVQPQAWDSIVVLDSSLAYSDFVARNSRTSLQLQFDDITSPVLGKVAPTHSMILDALEFGLASERLLVCCRAGQSRSAAIAFSIVYEKLGKNAALTLLNPRRHSPNYRILQIADEYVDRAGLLNAYDEWGYENGDVRLTDFLDEIESEYDRLEAKGACDRISNAKSHRKN